mmetsp:Transcript_17749/g.45682  ORF Transcript_17749/g.45682 Transcript_17749/m.45682 type:complete len:224 (-) Transcript_17749:112-783(-)
MQQLPPGADVATDLGNSRLTWILSCAITLARNPLFCRCPQNPILMESWEEPHVSWTSCLVVTLRVSMCCSMCAVASSIFSISRVRISSMYSMHHSCRGSSPSSRAVLAKSMRSSTTRSAYWENAMAWSKPVSTSAREVLRYVFRSLSRATLGRELHSMNFCHSRLASIFPCSYSRLALRSFLRCSTRWFSASRRSPSSARTLAPRSRRTRSSCSRRRSSSAFF